MAKQHNDEGTPVLERKEKAANFSDNFLQAEFMVGRYRKPLVYGMAAVIGIMLIYFGYQKLIVEPQDNEAQEQIFSAQRYFEADSLKKAVDGDGNNLGFKSIADEYSGTATGNLAKYYLGISCLKLGRFQDAIDALESYSAHDNLTGILAEGAIADAKMELGNVDDAIDAYKKAAKKEHIFTTPLFLKKAAMACESKKDFSQALDLYKEIKEEYPQSPEGTDIEKYITRAEALAGK